ncbi:MAG: OmpH family outer membrane protein [Paludibacteraceae bacterium]|nr:OmpH family outer membrane protein [Bacteroidia bacterium]HRG03102.1 OmpH family outer membrane protein [Paludibacteraceae bacterium]
MIKKIALFMIALLPLGAMAQSLKIGHVNSQEIIALMPEVETMNTQMKEAQDAWEKELLKSREEYYAKIKAFQDAQATMTESIKQARQSELADMEQRISNLNQAATDDLQKKNQELAAPILDKVKKAMNDVAAENNFTYVFDTTTQTIVYMGPSANDITPLVKKKLNLKEKPAVTSPSALPAAKK